jgi:hypothetical protein
VVGDVDAGFDGNLQEVASTADGLRIVEELLLFLLDDVLKITRVLA